MLNAVNGRAGRSVDRGRERAVRGAVEGSVVRKMPALTASGVRSNAFIVGEEDVVVVKQELFDKKVRAIVEGIS